MNPLRVKRLTVFVTGVAVTIVSSAIDPAGNVTVTFAPLFAVTTRTPPPAALIVPVAARAWSRTICVSIGPGFGLRAAASVAGAIAISTAMATVNLTDRPYTRRPAWHRVGWPPASDGEPVQFADLLVEDAAGRVAARVAHATCSLPGRVAQLRMTVRGCLDDGPSDDRWVIAALQCLGEPRVDDCAAFRIERHRFVGGRQIGVECGLGERGLHQQDADAVLAQLVVDRL